MKKRIMGISLIIIGFIIIFSAAFMRYSSNKKQKEMISRFERTLKNMGEDNLKDGQSDRDSSKGENNIVPIAIMDIPKINLNVAVAEGTEEDILRYAVGHFEGTALPGKKGNFAVAGHRNYTYSEYFKRADELEKGDEIIVKNVDGEFKYKVTNKRIVSPEEISVLNPTENATLTLVTCTPGATKRLIINGELAK